MFKKPIQIIVEIFNLPSLLHNLYKNRELINTLTWRDFKARYRGSFGGVIWSVIQPLIMMAIYTLVFSTFLKVKFGNSDSPFTFAVFLLTGLLPWNAFSESFGASPGLIRSFPNLVKRVVFPLEVLPLNLVLTTMIQQAIGFLLLFFLALAVNQRLFWTLVYLPLIILIQILFMVGLCWIWTSLAVFLPDLRQITNLLLSALMFLTPLFYPREVIPAWGSPIVDYNPLAQVIEMYRKAFLTGLPITQQELILSGVTSLMIFLIGYFWFMRTKKGFVDVL